MTFGLALREIQITRNDLPHGSQFPFIQIIFGNQRLLKSRLIPRKSRKSHKNLFGICAAIDDLRRSLPVHGKMHLVLYLLEEQNRCIRLGVIVNFSGDRVHRKALDDVFLEAFRGPLPELGATQGLYAIAHRNNDIKVVEIHLVRLRFALNRPMRSGYSEFPNNLFFV